MPDIRWQGWGERRGFCWLDWYDRNTDEAEGPHVLLTSCCNKVSILYAMARQFWLRSNDPVRVPTQPLSSVIVSCMSRVTAIILSYIVINFAPTRVSCVLFTRLHGRLCLVAVCFIVLQALQWLIRSFLEPSFVHLSASQVRVEDILPRVTQAVTIVLCGNYWHPGRRDIVNMRLGKMLSDISRASCFCLQDEFVLGQSHTNSPVIVSQHGRNGFCLPLWEIGSEKEYWAIFSWS